MELDQDSGTWMIFFDGSPITIPEYPEAAKAAFKDWGGDIVQYEGETLHKDSFMPGSSAAHVKFVGCKYLKRTFPNPAQWIACDFNNDLYNATNPSGNKILVPENGPNRCNIPQPFGFNNDKIEIWDARA